MKGLKATLAEPAAELRALAVERLDHMLAAIWPAATKGDLQAQAGVLRLENAGPSCSGWTLGRRSRTSPTFRTRNERCWRS
jgi:hypothetical protein